VKKKSLQSSTGWLFLTPTKNSFHGHPKPLATPPSITRKSIALYYYTAQPNPELRYDGNTDWQNIKPDTA
jgi:hypothetical protein